MLRITTEKIPEGYRALIWDIEDGRALLIAQVESETVRSARYWARRQIKERGLP